MATRFLESGGDATQGLEFFSSTLGTVSIDASAARTGGYGLLMPGGDSGEATALFSATNPGRISFYVKVSALPDSEVIILQASDARYYLSITTGGVLRLWANGGMSTQLGSNGATLATATWYHITIVWSVTSTTVYSITVFVDGVSSITAVNSPTLVIAGSVERIVLGWGGNPGASKALSFDDIYIDSDASATDPGAIAVTAKLPTALNTNNFDTLGGSGANRYNRVSDRPLSQTNYIAHLGATDVQENFGLQAAATGDAAVGTPISRSAWIWAKSGPTVGTAPKATGSGAANAAGTTITATLSATVAAGDVVVVAVADQMTSTTTVTINDSVGGNTWTALSGPTTNTIRANKWYSVLTNGGASMVITATFTSQTASRAIAAAAWSAGLFSASPLDRNVTNANDSTTPFSCPTSGTLAQANEIVLAFTYSAGNTGFTATSPNLLAVSVASSGGGAAGNAAVAIGYQVVAATTAVIPVFAGTSRTSVQGTASLKYNTSGIKTAGTPKLMDNGSETTVTLTETAALFSSITDSASYPSNAAGIGMRSSGAGSADTYMYECGTLIAYTPSVAPPEPPIGVKEQSSQAVKRAAFF